MAGFSSTGGATSTRGGNPFSYPGKGTDIPPDSERTIVEYEVPVGKNVFLTGGVADGIIDGEFKLYIGTEVKEVHFNNWCERGVVFRTVEKIPAGTKVKITVLHWFDESRDFYGSLFFEIS